MRSVKYLAIILLFTLPLIGRAQFFNDINPNRALGGTTGAPAGFVGSGGNTGGYSGSTSGFAGTVGSVGSTSGYAGLVRSTGPSSWGGTSEMQSLLGQLLSAQGVLNSLPANVRNQPGIAELTRSLNGSIGNVGQFITGINSLDRLMNTDFLQGGVGGIGAGLQNLSEVLNIPLIQQIDGMKDLKGIVGELGGLGSALGQAEGVLKNPNVNNISALVSTVSQLSQQGGFLGSFLGGASSGVVGQAKTAADAISTALGGGNNVVNKVLASGALKQNLDKTIPALKKIGPGLEVVFNTGECTDLLSGAGGLIGNQFSSLIGKGVPVVEQGTLLNYSQQTRDISGKMCGYMKNVQDIQKKWYDEWKKKEFETDPNARAAADKLLREAKQNTIKTFKTDGKLVTEDGTTTSVSLAQTYDDFVNAGVRNASKRGQAALAAAGVPDGIMQKIAEEEEYDAGTAETQFTRSMVGVKGTAGNTGGYSGTTGAPAGYVGGRAAWDALVVSALPDNQPNYQYVRSRELLDELKAKAKEERAQTWLAGNGIAPVENYDIKRDPKYGSYYTKTSVVTPGHIAAANYNTYVNSVVTQTQSVQNETDLEQARADMEIAKDDFIKARETAQGRQTPTPDIGLTDVLGTLQAICRYYPTLGMCGNNAGFGNTGGNSGSTGVGGSIGGSGGSTGSTPPPAPTISITSTTATSTTRNDTSTITWNANYATACTATSDWITWGNGSQPTTTPTLIHPTGDNVGSSGYLTIYHPTIFKASVSFQMGNDHPYAVPAPAQTSINSRIIDNAQVVTYTPNTVGLYPSDVISLNINGAIVSTHAPLPNLTPAGIVTELKSAKVSLLAGDPRKIEYDKYEFGGTDALVISRVSPTTTPSTSAYAMQCTGPGGTSEKGVTLTF